MEFDSTDWVVFDLSTVLCRYQPAARTQALAEASGLNRSTVVQRVDDAFVTRCCCGHYAMTEMLHEIRTRLDADLTYAHLMSLWALAYEPQMATIIAISKWQQHKKQIKTAFLCNDTVLLDAGLPAYLPEADQLVTARYYSYQFQVLDSDPGLFAAVCESMQVPAGSILYVGEDKNAQSAASHAGWRCSELTDLLNSGCVV